ncbi:MAG: phosphoglycolate phosphatase [Arenicella sp.]|jgi:phosphoglycolate phosphatase
MYQLIIFDWDGTIMDSAQKISNCIQASARDVGLDAPTSEQAKSIIGLGLVEALRRLFPRASDPQINAMIGAYKHHFVTADDTEQKLFDGVAQGLQLLEDSGAVLAVATGKSRVGLDRAFAGLDLTHHFIASRCADETRSKPHPQMLLEILDFTAIDPDKAIMVGDTTFDLDMAANAQMAGLGAGYGVHSEQMLLDSKALVVMQNFNDIIAWFLDGRVEKAYA